MKKLLVLFLVFTLALTTLMACGDKKDGKAISEDMENYPIESIVIKTSPIKTDYFVGEPIKGDGMIITLNREGGRKQDIKYNASMTFTPATVEAEGTQTITVNYGKFTATFTVEAVPNTVNWALDNGTLTISGTGRMKDYSESVQPEWAEKYKDIETVIVSEGVISVGDCAFLNLNQLKTVSLASSVASIGNRAFEGCTYLTQMTVSAGVTAIGTDAFHLCAMLESFSVDSNNPSFTAVDGVLLSKDQTTLVLYPYGNPAETYVVPSTVKTIGERAFGYNSTLKGVTLPAGVWVIEKEAFVRCIALEDLAFSGDTTAWGKVAKGIGWNANAKFTAVHCTNGDITDLSQAA